MENKYIRYKEVIYKLNGILLKKLGNQYLSEVKEELLYKSISDAEKAIKEIVFDDQSLNRNRFCFIVYEIPLGVNCTQNIRTYTHRGELFVESTTSDYIDECWNMDIFMGRNIDERQFKLGDVVAVYGNVISLEIICATPPEKLDVEYMETKGLRLPYWRNDSYLTINAQGEFNYRHVYQCLPTTSITIGKDVEQKLKDLYKDYTSQLIRFAKKAKEIKEFKPFDSICIKPQRSGLPYITWIQTSRTALTPVVRFTEPNTDNYILASVERFPVILECKGCDLYYDDIEDIENWIIRHCDTLLAYWAQDIDSEDFFEKYSK